VTSKSSRKCSNFIKKLPTKEPKKQKGRKMQRRHERKEKREIIMSIYLMLQRALLKIAGSCFVTFPSFDFHAVASLCNFFACLDSVNSEIYCLVPFSRLVWHLDTHSEHSTDCEKWKNLLLLFCSYFYFDEREKIEKFLSIFMIAAISLG
jgi:hypothetical protein